MGRTLWVFVVVVALLGGGVPAAAASPAQEVPAVSVEPVVFEAAASRELSAAAGSPRASGPELGVTPEVVGELVEARTVNGATFELSDGTFETVLSSVPMHVEQGSGAMGRVDLAVEPQAGG